MQFPYCFSFNQLSLEGPKSIPVQLVFQILPCTMFKFAKQVLCRSISFLPVFPYNCFEWCSISFESTGSHVVDGCLMLIPDWRQRYLFLMTKFLPQANTNLDEFRLLDSMTYLNKQKHDVRKPEVKAGTRPSLFLPSLFLPFHANLQYIHYI